VIPQGARLDTQVKVSPKNSSHRIVLGRMISLSAILMLAVIIFTLLMGFLTTGCLTSNNQSSFPASKGTIFSKMNLKCSNVSTCLTPETEVVAPEIDPSNINISQKIGRTQYARFGYHLMTGPDTNYTSAFNSYGYLNLLNDTLGEGQWGGLLFKEAFQKCSDIPALNSITITDKGSYDFFFEAPQMTVPSHFPLNPDEAYQKRMKIFKNRNALGVIEFNCDSSDYISSLYARIDINSRETEFYYQENPLTKSRNLDFFSICTDSLVCSGEKVAYRFISADGVSFIQHLVRIYSGVSSVNLQILGKHNVVGARVNILTGLTTDNQYIVNATYRDCINFSTNLTATGCGTVANSANVNINGQLFKWRIVDLNNLILTTLPSYPTGL
jgi:hypothetical protein